MMRSLFSTILIVGVCFVQVMAQTGTISGNVSDAKSGDPLPFVNLYLKTDKQVGGATDIDGNYSFKVPVGQQVIVISSVEHGKTERTVTVTDGGTLTVNFQLEMKAIEMNTFVVKADKYEKPIEDIIASIELIKPNIIENKGITDVTGALEQAPGLTIVDNEPQIRGGSGYSFGAGSRVMVLVDDLPLLTGDAGRPSWGFIPIENIEQIEVIKGASSVLYGSAALNGTINIRTGYARSEPRTRVSFLTGVYDSPRREEAKWWEENNPFYSQLNFSHSRRIKEDWDVVFGGSLNLENGYIGPEPLDLTDTSFNASTINKPSFDNQARFNFKLRHKNPKVKGLSYGVNGNIQYSRSTSTLLWDNDTTGVYRAGAGAFTTTLQTTFAIDPFINYYDEKGNKHSFNTRVFYQNNDNNNNQANKNYTMYGEYRYLRRLTKIPNFTISTGLVGQHVIGESELFKGGSGEDEVKRTSSNVGGYLQLDKKFWGRLNVTLGGRVEYNRIDTVSETRPVFRTGFSVKVHQETYIRGSFGQGFRFPTIAEKFIQTTVGGISIIPNEGLESEKSWNAELGIKQGLKIGKFLAYLDVAGFIQQYNNNIEFIASQWLPPAPGNPPFGFRSVNTGDARVAGVDVSLLGQGNFTEDFGMNILAGYTWSRPVALQPTDTFAVNAFGRPLTYENSSSDTENNILKYRFEHLVKLDIEFTYKNFNIGASYRYYSFMQNVDQFFVGGTRGLFGVKTYREKNDGGTSVADMRVSYVFAKYSKIAFIINNLANKEYALRPLAINPTRTYAVQYTLTLGGN